MELDAALLEAGIAQLGNHDDDDLDSPIDFAPPGPPPAPPPAAEPWEPFDLDLPDLELEDAEPAAAAVVAVDIDVRGGFQGLPGDLVRARVGSRADAVANARKVLLEKRTSKKGYTTVPV